MSRRDIPSPDSPRPGGMQNPDYERLDQPGKAPMPEPDTDGDVDVPGPGDGPRGPKG
ncbi:hypothetical protein [Frigidibacter sp.]|uniref:hypothetical protein n=1 Tax=Frigidibacter sp. TaxID=2586418 RepID=UPI00273231ED|nr:hypothetical protein [Frigidibacter sp.]MDP3342694.1 hypothetical protein [Frigidibacter sp.]